MAPPKDLFFSTTEMNRGRVQSIVDDTLAGTDDGELFLEYARSESFSFDDGRLRAASYDTTQGFGLRAVAGEATGYAHASELSEDAISRAADAIKAVRSGHSGTMTAAPPHMSYFMSSIFCAGLMEIPPVSKVIAFPRKTSGAPRDRPDGL